MLRFLPDGWLEGLLRPFLLLDPVAGLYAELAAPDWRFALLITCLLVVLAARRGRLPLAVPQKIALLSLAVMFYVWTFAIGNARYFVAGLLLVGPLLMMGWRLLPGTLAFRSLMLVGILALQGFAVQLNYVANAWGVVPWRGGQGPIVQASPLREHPAIFLTLSVMSYSILVPHFHPKSRWANIAGQRDITPAAPEYPRLQALLKSPLPKYVVVPAVPQYLSKERLPIGPMRDFLAQSLAVHGLVLSGAACTLLRSDVSAGSLGGPEGGAPYRGFWFCPVQVAAVGASSDVKAGKKNHEFSDIFERVERRCPRFFPAGDTMESHADGILMRRYPMADTRIYIDGQGQVLFKYFRSMNPTLIGTVNDVRLDRFTIACDKLPGRYQPPWVRGWAVELE